MLKCVSAKEREVAMRRLIQIGSAVVTGLKPAVLLGIRCFALG